MWIMGTDFRLKVWKILEGIAYGLSLIHISTMDVTVNDIVFGGDLIVDAVLPVDATGEVVITVNGVD